MESKIHVYSENEKESGHRINKFPKKEIQFSLEV
jgi:hypothetical protein